MAAGYEYHVESVWGGFLFGGWDSDGRARLEDILNRLAGEGWRLISTQSQGWWPPFIRPKLLLVFERRAE